MGGRVGGEGSLVRILARDGHVAGVGVLVGDREVITCAHVINAALGVEPRGQEQPEATFRVEFPLLRPDHGDRDGGRGDGDARAPRRDARVVRWLPPPREGAAGDDVAGVMLSVAAPIGASVARLLLNPPTLGQELRVFGYPPGRPDGVWAAARLQGRVGGGQLQLDSDPGAAWRVQPGFSGSPVLDPVTGRVVGIIAAAAAPGGGGRDSYAITAERLRLAWPEVLDPRHRAGPGRHPAAGGGAELVEPALTILHLSDCRLTAAEQQPPGQQARGAWAEPLQEDLARLAAEHGLRPDLVVVSGDLTEHGMPSEFERAHGFLSALAESVEVPRGHIAWVPGSHDVNRLACQAYFLEELAGERQPLPPYVPKWRHYEAAFHRFYLDAQGVSFTPDEPWSLFEVADLRVVVAGVNSTMADSHRDDDHYGWVGPDQWRWFAERLRGYRDQGWLRLAVLQHPVSGAEHPRYQLRDATELDTALGQSGLIHLVLHGRGGGRPPRRLPSGVLAIPTGRDPATAQPHYQLLTVRRDGIIRHARRYASTRGRWRGHTRDTGAGTRWQEHLAYPLRGADGALPPPKAAIPQPFTAATGATTGAGGGDDRGPHPARGATAVADGEREEFLERVMEATQVRMPAATVTVAGPPGHRYLRVSHPLPGGAGAEQWPVGVVGEPDEASVRHFTDQVHARFAAADPSVRSELVHAGAPAPAALTELARRGGVRLRSFVDYQGLLDLRPLTARQSSRLAHDPVYPASLYVPQRYRRPDRRDSPVHAGLLEQVTRWLAEEDARLVLVLGDSGRGKTALLRQLARSLPAELPRVLPVLVELRGLEKAPSLDELLGQHLIRNDVDDVNPRKLQYMIRSGRLALLFDGFDELELRVGYDNATDYLQVLLQSVTERAKVVLTSRTQHFRSTAQIRTALGDRIAGLGASRIALLEEFREDQILRFLTNRFAGDAVAAAARYQLLSDIEDLRGLSRNPRMLAFIAALDEQRLRDMQAQHGRISAAELYRELIDFWLIGEAHRKRHRRGRPALNEAERLAACTALAIRSWASPAPNFPMTEISEQVLATLTGLAERGYSSDHATHAIGSGSLLVRTEEDRFAFIHQSIMEWLVANAAATELLAGGEPRLLTTLPLSRLMVDFLVDLAGVELTGAWADRSLTAAEAPAVAKTNALAVSRRVSATRPAGGDSQGGPESAVALPQRDLAGVDLRGADLTGVDLRGANLRGADLREVRWEGVDLTGADLTRARLDGAVLIGGSLRGARLAGSSWRRAALLGVDGTTTRGRAGRGPWRTRRSRQPVAAAEELAEAAIPGRDRAQVMLAPGGATSCVAFSPDGTLLLLGRGGLVELVEVTSGRTLRVLAGHSHWVNAAVFSPDGAWVATASDDRTARIWETSTGTLRTTLTAHTSWVRAVAFSPDGALVATAATDGTARIWETSTGTVRTTLTGHSDWVRAVAFSPDGTWVATASDDGTARIWESATGDARVTLPSRSGNTRAVAFSPDGAMLATASPDHVARIWDVATGTVRTTLIGHAAAVRAVAFSPDGHLLATASDDGTARIVEHPTGAHRLVVSTHTGAVRAVAFSPDGHLLATASTDGTARIWDATTGAEVATLTGHTHWVTAVAFSPDGTLVATASDDRTARIWNLADAATRTTLTAHTNWVRAVTFSPDGTLVATACDDRTARIWSLADGAQRTTLTGHTGRVTTVAFSPDGAWVTTAATDGTARIWDATTGALLATLTGHTGGVRAAVFSPDGTLVATASSDGTARIWDAATGALLVTLVGLPAGGFVTLLRDGSYKLLGAAGDRVWWAVRLRRFAPGELDPYVDGLRRLTTDTVILPRLPRPREPRARTPEGASPDGTSPAGGGLQHTDDLLR